MSQRFAYSLRIIAVSVPFMALTLAGIIATGVPLTLLNVGIVAAIFVVADSALIIFTSHPAKADSHATDSSKSPH